MDANWSIDAAMLFEFIRSSIIILSHFRDAALLPRVIGLECRLNFFIFGRRIIKIALRIFGPGVLSGEILPTEIKDAEKKESKKGRPQSKAFTREARTTRVASPWDDERRVNKLDTQKPKRELFIAGEDS